MKTENGNSLLKLYHMAHEDDEFAFKELIARFDPLLKKVSCIDGIHDEDCYQECITALYLFIKKVIF